MQLELWHYLLLVVVGVVAGFLNVMAGGGSLLTMPLMIFMGMTPALAHGSNRNALIAQNLTAIGEFKRRGFADFKLSLSLALCTLPGAVLGAWAAIRMDPLWFKRLLAVVMIGVLVVTLWPKRKGQVASSDERAHNVLAHLGMLGVGFYGGFIQAGVGFVLLSVLGGTLRYDLVRANALKLICTFVFGVVSLAVFVVAEQVVWLPAVILAVATATGAQIAVRFALRTRHEVLRWIVFCAIVAACVGAFFKA